MAAFQQKMTTVKFSGKQCTDFGACPLKIRFLHICKGKKKNRISPLQRAIFLILPDGKPLEQISPPLALYRKELLQHTHGQSLAKTVLKGGSDLVTISREPSWILHGRRVYLFSFLASTTPYPLNGKWNQYSSNKKQYAIDNILIPPVFYGREKIPNLIFP